MDKKMVEMLVLLVVVLMLAGVSAHADVFTDDFSNGLDPAFWEIQCNDSDYYTLDDTQGDLRIIKAQGGSVTSPYLLIKFAKVRGDFDVRIDFRDANINRISGNENQVNLTSAQDLFAITRSDASGAGNNIHVFQYAWFGTQPCSDTSGTLRITRIGTTLTGYLNDNLIASRTGSGVDTENYLQLYNYRSYDPTSVTFDNFYIEADQILWTADFNEDGSVNLIDFAELASAWLSEPGDGNWNAKCDINLPKDNVINVLDLDIFTWQWLIGTEE